MRLYTLLMIMFLVLASVVGCGGNKKKEKENYFNRILAAVQPYQQAPAWEAWTMAAVLTGNDKKDYSFVAKVVITRDGDKIRGFGNSNGYDLGNFYIDGTRKGDNLDFELLSQNRYRAFSLKGRGIYINSGAKIGGNRLEGSDFSTVFDDPIDYTGNFTVNVAVLTQPVADGLYTGEIDGAYNSIENGIIRLTVNDDLSALSVNLLSGSLVGSAQSEGIFDLDNPSGLAGIPIEANKFFKSSTVGDATVEIDGAICGSLASGFLIIQRLTDTYVGAFTVIVE